MRFLEGRKSPPAPLFQRGERYHKLAQAFPPLTKGGQGGFEDARNQSGMFYGFK